MLMMLIGGIEITTVIIVALMVIGYAIYRRSFKLKKSDVAFLIGSIIPIVLVGMLNT